MGLIGYFNRSKQAPEKSSHGTHSHLQEHSISDEKPPTAPYTSESSTDSPASLATSSKYGSRRTSYMEELRHEIIANYLFQQQCAIMWIGDGSGETEGVLVRKSRANYLACPPDLILSSFAQSVVALNLPCAMTINSRVVKTYLAWAPGAIDVPLKNGLRVQVLPGMEDLPRARKAQSAAFIASDGLLVIWDDGEFFPSPLLATRLTSAQSRTISSPVVNRSKRI